MSIPERSRYGLGVSVALQGFDAPPLWTHGEQHALHVRDDEALRIEAARVRMQQERDAEKGDAQ